ncbi:CTD kinase subunit gamma CTK3-domain-containing protein [Limtongia smithiae]|uniref:CTD kinase subunit gamma CTK3-domain-containing protein n=1 Tax=Limtongia smithiae TaxID=1125753 RepID=UPI0034CDD37D
MPMDAFDARLKFTELLRRLTASVQSATKCAQFAIKNSDMSEDLYSCIVEELDKATLNSRINLLFLLEVLCDNCSRTGLEDYLEMVKRDLWPIFDKVVPITQGALANVAHARKALDNLRQKGVITAEIFDDVSVLMAEREAEVSKDEYQIHKKASLFSTEDILKRMEEDRERHKRMRENVWEIPPGNAIEIEFSEAWETTSDLGDDDYELMREESALLSQALGRR